MHSSVLLFGRSVPLYGIFYFTGIFAAAIAALLIVPKKQIPRYDVVYSAVYTVLGGVLGAKLLFMAVSWRQIVELQIPFLAVLKGGFVFYGGLIGGILGLWIYCRQFHLPFLPFADLYAAVLPLGHAFGRVGCFFAGCCYGIPHDGVFSVTYHETPGTTPTGTPLLPIQLIEATGLLLLFIVLLFSYRRQIKANRTGTTTAAYALLYAVIRFTVEWFRGDRERGILLGISTSQWISVGLFLSGAMLLYRVSRRTAK